MNPEDISKPMEKWSQFLVELGPASLMFVIVIASSYLMRWFLKDKMSNESRNGLCVIVAVVLYPGMTDWTGWAANVKWPWLVFNGYGLIIGVAAVLFKQLAIDRVTGALAKTGMFKKLSKSDTKT